ncbi:MAG: hypothetical protein AUG51_14825 [Acidobacteria bacterium 13_1_20CM_3_53_8]|nr:MAG: hypothetical protein AUG51_14825 [Acidobacteria bacterium 13_1_20CM_3_53_8]
MNKKFSPNILSRAMRVVALLVIICAFGIEALAQNTAAGTQIQNQASATYSDGGGGSYSSVSNTVTVTVAQVSGLTITPDAGSVPNVVPGQTGVNFSFTVTNTGNFSDQVRFLASGASVNLSGPATLSAAWIDVNGNGTYESGTDVDIKSNGADVLSSSLAQNASLTVVVVVNVNAGATGGNTINVQLGDTAAGGPSFDNQAADSSAHEVRTVATTSVNGMREARGDRTATVDTDAQLQLALTAPAGPVPLGSTIAYDWQLCNTGIRAASAVTLTNAPAGSNSGVFIIAPIPAGTQLDATQSFPGGVGVLYSTSPLSNNPLTTAVWTTTLPPLASVTRVAFNVGATLAAGACSPSITLNVKITTTDATNSILEQGDAYAKNTIGTQITAQSPQRQTLLQMVGSVLNGPQNAPGAIGPTDNNDDYTNKSVSTGIAGIAPGGATTASGVVTFTNTLQNSGNANDTFTLAVPTFPAGSTVKVTVNAVQTVVVNNGVATGNAISPVSLAFGASADYQVEVTLPSGKTVLTGYDTVIRATSGNTNTSTNDTIDRVYTGFVQLTKTATVNNSTGVGGPNDAVPGAVITFKITYTNVSSSGGTGCVTLTASNIVITEDGTTNLPNNWATYTTHVVGATDSLGGTITGDVASSNVLTDTIASLAPGASGDFIFKRQIK